MSASDWQRLLQAGRRELTQGRSEAAIATLRQALTLAPGESELRYWLGNALRLAGRRDAAEKQYRQVLAENPADADTSFALAFLLREHGRTAAAAAVLTALAGRAGDDVRLLLRISGFLRDSNRFSEAIETLQRAVKRQPDDAALAFRLARLYQATGRFDSALDHLRSAVAREPTLAGAWLSLAQLQHFDAPDNEDLRRLLAAAQLRNGSEADMCIAFSLGKAHDDLGEWATAWHWYVKGNRLRHSSRPWNRAGWRRQYESLLAAPTPANLSAAEPTRHPVYIVGMLRAGTTLLEQLLDRHPRITGRGELNFLAHHARAVQAGSPLGREAVAADLWRHLRLNENEQNHYVDKNPLNFRFLGFLAETLPEARIVHVTRDACDACLSCYFQLFAHPEAGFANDLDDLLEFYRGYRRLMTHWDAVLGDRVVTVAYEDLVEHTRPTLERVIDHLGLDWDPSLERENAAESTRPIRTASTWQARQPIHRGSVGRWRNYREFAPEFFDALMTLDRD